MRLWNSAGASHVFRSGACGATSPPVEEVGPTVVFESAFDGKQGVGIRLRPVVLSSFESVAVDLLASAFHDTGSDRQFAFPVEIVARMHKTDFNKKRETHPREIGSATRKTCMNANKPVYESVVCDFAKWIAGAHKSETGAPSKSWSSFPESRPGF